MKGNQVLRIGKYLFNPKYFYKVIKGDILGKAGDFAKTVGKNPDIGVKGAKIILKGAKKDLLVGKHSKQD